MGLETQQSEIFELSGGFQLISNQDGAVELLKNGEPFELLCTGGMHPYCDAAERLFLETRFDGAMRREESCNIVLCVRNRHTFEDDTITIPAKISIKSAGVRSAIVLEPNELRGLLCSPSPHEHGKWVVFRPFNANNVQGDFDQGFLSPLAQNLSIFSNPYYETVPECVGSVEDVKLGKKGVISNNEKVLFRSVMKTYIQEDDDFDPYMEDDKTYKLEVDDISRLPAPEENVYIIGVSPYQWLTMDPMDSSFSSATPTYQGFHEFVKGKVVKRGDGSYVFDCEDVPTYPKKVSVFLYTLSPDRILGATKVVRENVDALKI